MSSPVLFGNRLLHPVDSVTYLGVTLDSHFSFSANITLAVSSNVDAVCCKVRVNSSTELGVLCIYRPPNSSLEDNNYMLDIISEFLSFHFKYNIIVGDFNFPDIRWPTHALSAHSTSFLNFCQENFLSQHISLPTRRVSNSILDLVFSTEGTDVNNIIIGEEFGSSDHSIIQFSLNIRPSVSKNLLKRRSFSKTNWCLFQELLSANSNFSDILKTKNIDMLWVCFCEMLTSALDQVAPLHVIPMRRYTASSFVRTALRAKRRCFKNMISNRAHHNILAYKRSCIILKRNTDRDASAREELVISNPNPKIFWSFVKSRLSRRNVIKSICDSEREIFDSDSVANIFNDHFSSNFSSLSNPNSRPIDHVSYSDESMDLSCINITVDDVYSVLKCIPPKTSVDADGLSYMILKKGGSTLCLYLVQLFRLSLELRRIPIAWKTAIVVPIFKNGCKKDVRNYRPISITSCCSRILERIINNKIINHLTLNNLITPTQHGFQRGRSTDTALLDFYEFVSKNTDNRRSVEVVLFDLSKAFDSVSHGILLLRLKDVGIGGQLLDWINSFLTSRYQQVRVGDSFSRPLPVRSGVIQGSILGPTFFSIFINNVESCLEYCKIIKYADDLRVFLSSPRTNADILTLRQRMQSDINNLVCWINDSGLSFNAKKCFSTTFGLPSGFTQECHYKIHSFVIPQNVLYRDLGVTVSSPLSFNSHIDEIVSKAFSRLGLIYKLFRHTKNPSSLIRLYKTFVRPILEYACIIWNPCTLKYSDKIERVQRRFCRMLKNIRHLSYKDQLTQLNILSLQARRIGYQLIYIHKIHKNLTKVDFDSLYLCLSQKDQRQPLCHSF